MFEQLCWFWTMVRSCRKQAVINIVLGLLMVVSDLCFIVISKELVDTATGSSAGGYELTSLAVILVCLVVLQIVLRVAHRWVAALLGVKAQNLMQQRLFRIVLDGVWQGRERRHTGDIVNRLETDVRTIIDIATEKLPQITVVVFRLIAAFVLLFTLDSRLAIAVIVILPVFILLSRLYFRKMRHISREIRNTDSRVQSILQEYVQHYLLVKTLQRTDESVGRLADEHTVLRQQIRRRTVLGTFSMAIVSLGFSGVYLITFLWGAYQLHNGIITYGTLIAFVQLVAQIQMPLRELTRFVPSVINGFTSIERLMQLDAMPRDNQTPSQNTLFDHSVGVRFNDVSFRYSEQQRLVLDNFSVDFRPGTVSAIVGRTGAGKTTIVRLILALIKPQKGTVEVYCGNSILPASVVTRSEVLYVPQGNTLLSGTIRDNLLLGCPTADENQMREALHIACADFVYNLKDGLNTRCGELGNGLSEGQAQRIAIARSLLNGGRIMLFDEVTSALDLETESTLLQNLCALARNGSTVVFITHRQEVLKMCSQIISL